MANKRAASPYSDTRNGKAVVCVRYGQIELGLDQITLGYQGSPGHITRLFDPSLESRVTESGEILELGVTAVTAYPLRMSRSVADAEFWVEFGRPVLPRSPGAEDFRQMRNRFQEVAQKIGDIASRSLPGWKIQYDICPQVYCLRGLRPLFGENTPIFNS